MELLIFSTGKVCHKSQSLKRNKVLSQALFCCCRYLSNLTSRKESSSPATYSLIWKMAFPHFPCNILWFSDERAMCFRRRNARWHKCQICSCITNFVWQVMHAHWLSQREDTKNLGFLLSLLRTLAHKYLQKWVYCEKFICSKRQTHEIWLQGSVNILIAISLQM